jgi:protein gp37
MADRSAIEWTDATWNPVQGCTRVSEGCRNCYAEVMAARFSDPGQWGHGLAHRVTVNGKTDHRWTGELRLNEKALELPLRWRRPRRIFVNSTSDLFHEDMPDEWIDRVFAVMALAQQHTFQILTKRPERMQTYVAGMTAHCGDLFNIFASSRFREAARKAGALIGDMPALTGKPFPLRNVWLGTSVEDQSTANIRIPHLMNTPAAGRFISAEPLLGRLDLEPFLRQNIPGYTAHDFGIQMQIAAHPYPIDWVIVGGESGPGARPMHPAWARSLRDQCQAALVPFFFKQWGEWGHALHMAGVSAVSAAPAAHNGYYAHRNRVRVHGGAEDGHCFESRSDDRHIIRVGKKAAGRLLDGREWNEAPG